ncbi:hypothetical protein GLYMA_15G107400v4 [Glycine max]|uniref:Uncharacterized protein n=1 Tax=Glycine max TaxID=3847 RepID=A0A0R0GA24_SOYBN|nr:hypothetical protein JHK87_041914 [Glycine soja]KAH1146586.1 hypothetical protein GYH30_041978 [Glycine max]KRH11423.1 hypothetical protein GLYMA_15G107400v4 [Glycine max]
MEERSPTTSTTHLPLLTQPPTSSQSPRRRHHDSSICVSSHADSSLSHVHSSSPCAAPRAATTPQHGSHNNSLPHTPYMGGSVGGPIIASNGCSWKIDQRAKLRDHIYCHML